MPTIESIKHSFGKRVVCTSLALYAPSLKKNRTGKMEMNYFWLITKSSLLSCAKNKTISLTERKKAFRESEEQAELNFVGGLITMITTDSDSVSHRTVRKSQSLLCALHVQQYQCLLAEWFLRETCAQALQLDIAFIRPSWNLSS